MKANRGRSFQPWGLTRCISPATDASHSGCSREPAAVGVFVNPLDTLKDPSKVHTEPYLHPTYRYPMRTTLYVPYLSRSAATPPRASSVCKTPAQSRSTHPSPVQPPSIPIPHGGTSLVPSKGAHDYTPSPSALYRDSPAPPLRVQLLRSSTERATKRPRPDAGCPGVSPPSSVGTKRTKRGKVARHPLSVDYSRSIQPVDVRPPRYCQKLERQNRIPLPPDPEIGDWKHLLEEGLRGPVDPAIARELGDLMWMQQKRVWGDEGGYSDPLFDHLSRVALLDIRPSSLKGGLREEVMALYGPIPRTNNFTHLGERLVNSSVIELNDDEEGDGVFEDVLDLYRGAVEGSILSMEI